MDIEIKMPNIGSDEVEVIEILVNINEKIELEQGLITVEGDKTSMEIPSPISGVLKNIFVKIGQKVKTDSCIMMLEVDKINFDKHKKEDNNLDVNLNSNIKKKITEDIFFHATPFIRRLARNLNIDLCNVIGTGPKNRILKEDIKLYQKNILEAKKTISLNDCNILKKEEVQLSDVQKAIGQNLQKNWINIPHVTQFDEVNITVLEKFRKKYNKEKKNKNKVSNNITILVFIIKVIAYALEKFPVFNSSLTSDNKKIVLKKYINIGFAIDVDNDLFVPVLKDVDKKNIEQLSSELVFLSEKARERKLNTSDMKGGSFTVSNLGGIGGSWFSPIINAPEVAILGVSKSQIKPLWNGKEFIPSLMLPLSLSYDHRIINGAQAAHFITFVGRLLSDIRFLIM